MNTHKSGIGHLSRRSALSLFGLGGVAACSPAMDGRQNQAVATTGQFGHGVASGDPSATSVILWTHVSADQDGPVDVIWEIDQDPNFSDPLTGQTQARLVRDYTVKVEAIGLEPGRDYYYRFRVGETLSPVGRTKTLPEGETKDVRLAVVSCSNYEHGYFNVYDLIAQKNADEGGQHFDALIHLGDYYYEYGANTYDAPNKPGGDRIHEPANEIVTLDDYRTRHAQYRRDANLQAVTAGMPLIAIWDDHETSNDSWRGGAENHDESEGDWAARKEAALRAYYEWMPVREPEPGRAREAFYRHFQFGDLLTLVGVETRLTARAEPFVLENFTDEIVADPDGFKANRINDPTREMLGTEQRDYIVETFAQSKANGVGWRMLANQVIIGRLLTPDFTPYVTEEATKAIEKDWPGIHDFLTLSKYSLPFYPDSWDGYPVARERFYAALDLAGVNDMLVVTGDAHEFWANDLTREDGTKMGAEFVTSSVSSKTLTAYLGDGTADHNLLLTQQNPDALYYNALNNGFMALTITPKTTTVDMWAVDKVNAMDYNAFRTAQFTVKKQQNSLKITRPKGLNLQQRALFHGLG